MGTKLSSAEVQQLLEVAQQQHSQGEISKAEAAYQQVLQSDPGNVDALYLLGGVSYQRKDFPAAMARFRDTIKVAPEHADAHFNLGNAFREIGDCDAAVVHYRKAIDLEPQHISAHSNLGGLLRDAGQIKEAIRHYEKAIAIHPQFVAAHYNLANALQQLGQADQAIYHYQKVIALDPNAPQAHNNLGTLLSDLGQFKKAEVHYRKVLELDPDNFSAFHNLGNTLQTEGKMQEAVNCFQQAFTKRTGIQPVGNKELAPAINNFYLELTNKCNFHCDFCPSDLQKRAIGFMDLEFAKKMYAEVARTNLVGQVDLHLMGEPTLHPKLIDILEAGAALNVKTELVTNGSTLSAKMVPRILDALYGTIAASHMTPTEGTYKYRGKVGLSWERYIESIQLLVRDYIKRLANGEETRNEVELRIMITKDTAANVDILESNHEAIAILREWVTFAKQVESELGMVPFDRKEPNSDSIRKKGCQGFMDYQLQRGIKLVFWEAFTFANSRVGDEYALEFREDTAFCPHPFNDFGVLWNGDVTLCCMDYDGQLKVGNIQETPLEEVLQGQAAQDLRASMLGKLPLPTVCQTCQARPVMRSDKPANTGP